MMSPPRLLRYGYPLIYHIILLRKVIVLNIFSFEIAIVKNRSNELLLQYSNYCFFQKGTTKQNKT